MEQMEMNWDVASDGPNTILDLPAEILGEIFNKLEQAEVPQLCLVSRQFKETVEGYYNFTVSDLDEDSPQSEHILSLRIAYLQKIRKLIDKEITTLPVPIESEPETPRLRLIFKHPNVIQRISITKNCNISLRNLAELLQLCQENVTELDLHLEPPLSTSLLPFSNIYNFKNLQRLKLTFMGQKEGGNDINRDGCLLYQFANSKFKSLNALAILVKSEVVSAKSSSSILPNLLRLVAKNPGGLEWLTIEFGASENTLDVPETGELVGLLASVRNLKWISFCSSAHDSLLDLIRRQRKLEYIDMGYNFEIRPALIYTVISNCFQTLVGVEFTEVKVSGDRPLDLSVFQHCLSLERLDVKKLYPSTTPDSYPHSPDLINFDSFPPNLYFLSLFGFKILPTDLEVLLDSEALLTLRDLRIANYSDAYLPGFGFGANCSVLEKLASLELENKNLERLRFYWNSTADPEEMAKCRPILEGLGYSLEEAQESTLHLRRNGNNLYRDFYFDPIVD